MKKSNQIVYGKLSFQNSKILLKTEKGDFFVIPKFSKKIFVDSDFVSAKIIKKADGNRLSEVILFDVLNRTNKVFIGKKIGKYIFPKASFCNLEKISCQNYRDFDDGNFEFIFEKNFAKIIKKFETEGDEEIETILFLNNISKNFSPEIQKSVKILENEKIFWKNSTEKIPENNLLSKIDDLENFFKKNLTEPLAKIVKNNLNEKRISLENWFTMTIDGSDAKDLDDAISIAKYKNGDFLLAVNIANVSYFVREKTALDKEAYKRGTSIYLGDRVIPMLAEGISNNLCSLNPDFPKLTLTCLMKIDKKSGKVLHTDIFESIIKSDLRGEYNQIFADFSNKNYENEKYQKNVESFFELFEILKKRREKEGKISFETTELYFDFSGENVENIRKRERNDAHKMIEEFMVLANEEVAKWCTKRRIPFLSRVHPEPSDDASKIIHKLLKHDKIQSKNPISSKDIEIFLKNLSLDERFFASRMILPKMSKAEYKYGQNGHFGLALDFYSHFTSPIRRYPDLITHRLISLYLNRKFDEKTLTKYQKILPKIADFSSQNEKIAENIERATDKIFISRFMKNQIGKKFLGKISSLMSWALFVELENGVEVTIFLPKNHGFQLDENIGALIDKNQKIIYQIGQKLEVLIEKIDENENKIIAKII